MTPDSAATDCVSFSKRLENLASADPTRPSVTSESGTCTRLELEARASSFACELAMAGVRLGDFVTIVLPNSPEWFVAVLASWKVGAIPQPVSSRLPSRELAAIVELAAPAAIVADDELLSGRPCLTPAAEAYSCDLKLPDLVSPSWKAPTSGGSTGRPKLIVSGDAALFDTTAVPPFLLKNDGCLVMPGPLYHNGPMVWSCMGLLYGNHIVTTSKFDALELLAAIEAHHADTVYLVPTMMKRIWRLPEELRMSFDLSSLEHVWHLAEPCPPWLKRAWIDWLGADRIMELYGGTEAQLTTVISGSRWLERPGSVGRPNGGEIMICDDAGRGVPPGVKGEVWLRSSRSTPTYSYVGAEARRRDGGWESLGDIGWVDADGYLYLVDRMSDMVLIGGANVYPAEVETALDEHPNVLSSAVVGLPDDDRGSYLHAIVQLEDPDKLTAADLLDFLRDRVEPHKLPRSFEFVEQPLRDDAGKVRRGALREERLPGLAGIGGS